MPTRQEDHHDEGVAEERNRDVEQRSLQVVVLVELPPHRLKLSHADEPAAEKAHAGRG